MTVLGAPAFAEPGAGAAAGPTAVAPASTGAVGAAAAADGGSDVARWGIATAASSYPAAGFEASNVNDGDPATRWGSKYTRAANPPISYDPTDDWIQIQLVEPTSVHHVVLEWEAAHATDYTIQGSSDGETWTDLAAVEDSDGGRDEVLLETDDSYGFIRMQGHGTATAYGYSIYSFEIWDNPPAPPAASDIARQGVATAASTYPAPGFEPASAIDGDPATRWGSKYTRTWAAPYIDYDPTNDWLQVELAGPSAIHRVVLDWEAAYAERYTVQGSVDGVTWTDLAVVDDGDGGRDEILLETTEEFTFVRMQGHELATQYGYSIYSFEIWDGPEPLPEPGEGADVARLGEASAASTYPAAGFEPANAIDGNDETRWGSKYTRTNPTITYDPTDDWLQVELAAPSVLHHVVLDWEAAHAVQYTIQASDDGLTWTDLAVVEDGDGGRDEVLLETAEAYSFVRMQGHDPATRFGYSIYAFEVWNGPEPEPAPSGEVVPVPVSQEARDSGPYVLTAETRLVADTPGARPVAELLAERLRAATGYEISVVDGDAGPADIALTLGDPQTGAETGFADDEAYRLVVGDDGVTATASTAHGLFNATQTLLQLLPAWVYSDVPRSVAWTAGATEIVDYPRFEARGLMLDPARNFIAVESVKAMIDEMAMVKTNRLHLHLTDDQGWRIEIKSWPNLTEHGGTGSMAGGISGYYTQEDFREIVAYANARFIDVVPEIDMPGHVDAALSSYPVLDCEERQIPIRDTGGVSHNALCTSKEITYEFVEDVISEVAAISTSEYFHIGADEAEGVDDEEYATFINRVESIVEANGKTMVGFTPMPKADPSASAVHQYWADRANEMSTDWFEGRQVILSPTTWAYLDYGFAPGERLGWKYTNHDTEQSYSLDPSAVIDETTRRNINASFGLAEEDILGIEGAIWGERLTRGLPDIEYMVWPRLAGLMEKAWSPAEKSADFDVYSGRLAEMGPRWMVAGTNFWPDPDVPWRTAAAGADVALEVRQTFEGPVATLASPGATADGVEAVIDWGDGATSVGAVEGDNAGDSTLNSLFDVIGTHVYTAPGTYEGSVSMTLADGSTTTAPLVIDVVPEPDSEPPVTVAAVEGEPGPSGWFTAPPVVTLSASDNVGVASTQYRLGEGGWVDYTGPVELGEGEHTLAFRSMDTSDLVEEVQELWLPVDLTAPEVNAAVDEAERTVSVEAADATSGVAAVEYSLDGGATWLGYDGPVEVGKEAATVLYRATDVAGLTSEPGSVTVDRAVGGGRPPWAPGPPPWIPGPASWAPAWGVA